MAKEWFTVKECLELPGFPGSGTERDLGYDVQTANAGAAQAGDRTVWHKRN